MNEPNLQALAEFVNNHPKLVTLRQMRRIVSNSPQNGAELFLRRVNRRIFIDVDKFFEWTKRKV